jgi:hypothetical protein
MENVLIAFRLLRRGIMKMHALLGHPVSENFVSWCQTLKKSKGELGSDEIAMFLTLPWKMC